MIYLIHNTNNNTLKIGYSKDPERRLKELLTGTSDDLIILSIIKGKSDCKYKKIYKDYYFKREWYTYSDEIVNDFREIEKKEERYKILNHVAIISILEKKRLKREINYQTFFKNLQ